MLNSICDELNKTLQERCNKQGQLVHPRLRVGDPFIVTDSFEGRLVRGETGQLCAVTAQGDLVLEFVTLVGPRSGLSRAAQHTAAANRQTLLEHHLRKMTPPRVPAAAGRTSLE